MGKLGKTIQHTEFVEVRGKSYPSLMVRIAGFVLGKFPN